MGEVSDVGTYTMAFTDALNPTFVVLLTIPVSRGCGWKLARTSAAVGCQATLPELPMRTRDSLSPTSPTSYCR